MSRQAVIVIGSNSTRYVSAQSAPFGDVLRRRVETRLFLHMENGLLSPSAIQDTVQGIAQLAASGDAPVLGVYATSAVRDARNADDLARAIERVCGLSLTVLTGPEEAAASFYGAAGEEAAGIIDIGGGSTEIAIGRGMQILDAVSLQLGASRLFAACPIQSDRDVAPALRLADSVLSSLSEQLTRHPGFDHFYSVGGTGTASAGLLQGVSGKERHAEGYILPAAALREKLFEIAAVPRDQRAAIPGFPPARVDILPTGMAILCAAMDRLCLREITVTERTNGDGLLRAAIGKNAP